MMYGEIAPAYSLAPRREVNYKTDSPGPGGYDAAKEFYKDATPFSFSKASRAAGYSPLALGPGQYDAHPPFYKEATTRSFSKAPRMALPRSGSPGPGTYSIKSSVGTGLSPIFLSRSKPVFKTDVPGPGTYDPLPKSKALQFSLGRKNTYQPRSFSPGPGAYDVSARDLASPLKLSTSMLPNPRKAETSIANRPWQRRLNGFGKAPRDPFKPNDLPGPGTYDLRMSPGRSARLYPRLASPLKNTTPGPGQYDLPSAIGYAGYKALLRKS